MTLTPQFASSRSRSGPHHPWAAVCKRNCSRETPMGQEEQLGAGPGAVCLTFLISEWLEVRAWERLEASTSLWWSGHLTVYFESLIALWVQWKHPPALWCHQGGHLCPSIRAEQPYLRQSLVCPSSGGVSGVWIVLCRFVLSMPPAIHIKSPTSTTHSLKTHSSFLNTWWVTSITSHCSFLPFYWDKV